MDQERDREDGEQCVYHGALHREHLEGATESSGSSLGSSGDTGRPYECVNERTQWWQKHLWPDNMTHR